MKLGYSNTQSVSYQNFFWQFMHLKDIQMWQVVHGSQEQCFKSYPVQKNLITSPVPLIHV